MSQGRPPPEGLIVFVALCGLFVALFLMGVVAASVVTPTDTPVPAGAVLETSYSGDTHW